MATSSRKPPWEKKSPVKPAQRQRLTAEQRAQAKARAEAAGRRYPNLVDNMYVARLAKDGAK